MYRTILNISFYLNPNGGIHGFAQKTINLPFVPTTNIGIDHPVWNDAKKPISVSYNIDGSYFFVDFEAEELDSESSISKNKEMYKLHGWDVSQ